VKNREECSRKVQPHIPIFIPFAYSAQSALRARKIAKNTSNRIAWEVFVNTFSWPAFCIIYATKATAWVHQHTPTRRRERERREWGAQASWQPKAKNQSLSKIHYINSPKWRAWNISQHRTTINRLKIKITPNDRAKGAKVVSKIAGKQEKTRHTHLAVVCVRLWVSGWVS